MLRKFLRIVGWMIGGIVGAAVIASVVILAINWRDQPPSQGAIRLEQLHRDRPQVAINDNAFLFVLGFNAAPTQDVAQIGLQRDEWLRAKNELTTWDSSGDPLSAESISRPARVARVVQACLPTHRGCVGSIDDSAGMFADWLATEPWLLSRYESLIDHSGWRETVPQHLAAPLPSFSLVMEGQRFLVLKAKTLADRNDFAGARSLLERDVRFWRMVLASADTLISKMIAVAALNRHFELGNMIMRGVPAGAAVSAVPSQWLEPFNDVELSMQRCIVGEWVFLSGAVRTTSLRSHDTQDSLLGASLLWRLYQPQDTKNLQAERYSNLLDTLDAPLSNYQHALKEATQLANEVDDDLLFHLYNPVGSWLLRSNTSAFPDYAARVADLEGVRRAALAAIELRGMQVSVVDVSAALIESGHRNPYDGSSLEWDIENSAILFRGLRQGERGEYRILY